jgi:putative transposase
VLDGPINGESFRVYVEHVLVPALAQGDIVVMDNSPPAGGVRHAPLGSHKGKAIRRAIHAAGARLFRPPPNVAGIGANRYPHIGLLVFLS